MVFGWCFHGVPETQALHFPLALPGCCQPCWTKAAHSLLQVQEEMHGDPAGVQCLGYTSSLFCCTVGQPTVEKCNGQLQGNTNMKD